MRVDGLRERARLATAFVVVALWVALVGSNSAAAATNSDAVASKDDWATAVLDGADVRSLAIAPADPDLVFAGTSSGQIFVSSDGGDRWREPADRISFPGWIVSDLEFDPNQPGRLWAAMWGLWGGGLVAYSDDLGVNWSLAANGLPETQVYTLALVPGRPGHLYVGTREGVYGTKDTGGAWRRLTGAHAELQKVTSLLVDPADPDTVLAGTWRRAYRSRNAGETWHDIFEGMVLDSEVFTLNTVPGRPGEIWASTCGWVYQGVGLGDRWTRHTSGLAERRTPSFLVLDNETLLAGTVSGAYRSVDGGLNWTRQTSSSLAILATAVHPERPGRIFLGTEGSGVWRSNDGGGHFERTANGMTNVRISALAILGNELYAAVRYAGPESGLYRSPDGGRTFTRVEAPKSLILDLAVSEGTIYAATEGGLFERKSSEWRKIAEVGDERVETVSVQRGEVLVRTSRRVLQLKENRFEAIGYRHGTPRSTAFFEGSVWLSDGVALHRRTGQEEQATALPYPGGRLSALSDRLVVAGRGGVWTRRWPQGPWETMVTEAARVLETDDAVFPLIVVAEGEETLQLYDAERGVLRRLAVPVPVTSVTTATVFEGRLVVGTSGYGVLSGPLPASARPAR